jgi:hypothetical protein
MLRPTSGIAVDWVHAAAILSALLLTVSITGIKLLTRQNSVGTIMCWVLSLPHFRCSSGASSICQWASIK